MLLWIAPGKVNIGKKEFVKLKTKLHPQMLRNALPWKYCISKTSIIALQNEMSTEWLVIG